ncbi:HAD family hydrolase [Alloprevotella sp. oral taxon 473]|jgi:HAD hydrolase, family IA, variant 1|uniref:HAD family hydrolase n=1 Tax=Alloprevotella sp. oral taxon 473 TaxID=712469 RepID=UPI0002A2E1BE|nr:HAD family hydrolase [Alloprevotella sp. oral taxon 473]EKX88372.1 putative phosphoglycolate phosphatase, bacterial [Alloprevotella sp. oral taxon 473 str. F0040]
MIKTVLFDLDGTLLNTLTDLSNSVNYALNSHHLPQRTELEVRSFLGNGIHNLIEKSVPENTPSELLEDVFQSFKSYYLQHGLESTAPYPGIISLLKALQQKSVKMAIISNKVDTAVQQLNKKFFSDYIGIAIGEKPQIRRKPAPDSVLLAIKALDANPATTLYVGDSEVDYETAHSAGIRCALVTWGFRDRLDLEDLHADYYVNSSHELMAVISEN